MQTKTINELNIEIAQLTDDLKNTSPMAQDYYGELWHRREKLITQRDALLKGVSQ